MNLQRDFVYDAVVLRVIDGDTLDLRVDLGFHVRHDIRIRIRGIDAAEIWRPADPAELELGRQAKRLVEELYPVGSTVRVRTYKVGAYGRWEGDVQTVSGKDLATELIARGLVK